jgi:hypothetical protein
MACLAATLTACAGSPHPQTAASTRAPDPVIQTKIETRVECPAELEQPIPARPSPAAGAVVQYNDQGKDWLSALSAWADDLVKRLTDADAACAAAKAKAAS